MNINYVSTKLFARVELMRFRDQVCEQAATVEGKESVSLNGSVDIAICS